ncbi:MAG: hypothetical protein CMK59_15215 [Proteobacteria bacterium]|nr:hypothetical protein [Pseudomonadota bacterium]
MFKALLRSITTIILLLVLIVLSIVFVAQNNNLEQQNIELIKIKENQETECVSTQTTNSSDSDLGVWSKYAFAFQDPSNLLSLDEEWLGEDAQKGGTLLSYLGSDPKGLNFLTQNGSDVSNLQNYIGIGLMRRHFNDTSKWHPELAYHMGRTEDFLTYTYKIRDDVFWHDPTLEKSNPSLAWLFEGKSCREGHFINGRCRVTAHDLVFMMDMLMNNQVAGAAPIRSYYSNLKQYRALDDFTFQVEFNKKTQTQDNMVRGIYPMPEFLYAYDEDGNRYDDSIIGTKFEAHWYDPNTIGAGPYRFVEFDPGVKIMLERDSRFPLGGNAFKKILFQIINDDQQRLRKMKKEEIHYTGLSPSQYRVEVVEGDQSSPFKNGTFGNAEYWSHTYYYIGWNNQSIFFNDKRVRQAMSHAFNADFLLQKVMMNLGKRCTGPMPAFLPFYDSELPPIPFDLEKAKSLLNEAGWIDSDNDGILDKVIEGQKTDFEFSLTIYGSSKEYKTIGDIFKEELAKVGVKMNVVPQEWSMLLKKIDAREFDAVTLAWVSGPDVDFRQIWHSTQADVPQSSNYISFRNEEADKIIEALEVEFDFDKRVELANNFHKLLYDEQPYTFFYTRRSPYYWNQKLKDVKAQTVRPYLNARAWHLTDGG